jgi:phosphomevalonate kinase
MMTTARAPGKLVLLGEYAVLEGAPALVAAVNRSAQVEVERGLDGFVVRAPDVGVREARGQLGPGLTFAWTRGADDTERVELDLVAACIEKTAMALATRGVALPPAVLSIDSHELRAARGLTKLGLGSSAAVATAIVAALLAFAGEPVDGARRHWIFDTTLEAHRAAQGRGGSGVDVAAAVFGGLLRFQRRRGETPVVEPLARPAWLAPIAIWSGRMTSTRAMIAAVKGFAGRSPTVYSALTNKLVAVADVGCTAVRLGDSAGFARAVEAYEARLVELGEAAGVEIVSPEHRRAGDIVRAHGGVYKPSGAGGGDLGLAFTTGTQTVAGLSAAVTAAGLDVVPLTLGVDGVGTGRS